MRTHFAIFAAIVLGAARIEATDGTVVFRNTSPVNAPVFAIDSTTKLSGPDWLAQLYYSASETGPYVATAGAPAPFRTGAGAGFWNPGADSVRVLTGIPAGDVAYVRVGVWESSKGATFEAASAAGGTAWLSSALKLTTGGAGEPPSLPAEMIGFNGYGAEFCPPGGICPEPSIVGLALLGAAALLMFRTDRLRAPRNAPSLRSRG